MSGAQSVSPACSCYACDYFEERAALREYQGGETRPRAEAGAHSDTRRRYGDKAAGHVLATLSATTGDGR